MTVQAERSADAATRTTAFATDLDRLYSSLPRMGETGLNPELVGRLSDHVGALRFLLHSGPSRPLIAGLVGGASCGKSTLFGSLVGRRISRIHYQPHSSLGPIAWLHSRHRETLSPSSPPRRFLPQFEIEEVTPTSGAIVGSIDRLVAVFHGDDSWSKLALIDLPDITSESSRREGWLVRRLLPWMDLIIWMVDPNDYLFEDLYNDLIDDVVAFGQRSIVVVNDIHGQIEGTNSVLGERIDRFRADAWFLLGRLACSERDPYPLFRDQEEFVRLRRYLQLHEKSRPVPPLAARVRQDAASIVHENNEWVRRSRELAAALNRIIARDRKRVVASAPLLSVLPEGAQQELENLRNRLSIWHQSKRLYRALRHPARVIGRSASPITLTDQDIDTDPLYRHLLGTLKEVGIEMHRSYLESRLVEHLQHRSVSPQILGVFEPATLEFKQELDNVAKHVFHGAQDLLSDPSLWKDKRFHFVASTTGVAFVFFLVEATLGIPGVSLLFTKGLAAAVGVLSPELARYLPLDRMSRLAMEARDMLGTVIDQQMRRMAEFYTASHGRYLEPDAPLLRLLERVQTGRE